MPVSLNHESVRALARNLRKRTGRDIKHSEILEDIAGALGWRADALMHSLKTEARPDGRKDASASPPWMAIMDDIAWFPTPHPEAPSMRPAEWMAHFGIIQDVVTGGLSISGRHSASSAFALQLGPRWHGPAKASPHVRCLIAALAAHISGEEKSRREGGASVSTGYLLLEDLDMAVAKNAAGPDRDKAMLDVVEHMLEDDSVMSTAAACMSRHAYEVTAMMSLLEASRSGSGIMASAQFMWLKAVDRNLWRCLSNVGRKSFHIEASGAIAHHAAEISAGVPLVEPRMDKAVTGLEDYLKLNMAVTRNGVEDDAAVHADRAGRLRNEVGVVDAQRPSTILDIGPGHALHIRKPSFVKVGVAEDDETVRRLTKDLTPTELWAFATRYEDVLLRNALYMKLGATEARRRLAERFPSGSAKNEVENRIERQFELGAEEPGSNIIDELVGEMTAMDS